MVNKNNIDDNIKNMQHNINVWGNKYINLDD